MTMNATSETFRPAFPDHDHPNITYGLSFTEACGNHVESTFNASRVYVISSGSLARNTEALANLRLALGSKIVGTRIGMKSHTLWSEILEIINEARDVKVDLLITLGAGSLTDGAKIIALVRSYHVCRSCKGKLIAKCRVLPTASPPLKSSKALLPTARTRKSTSNRQRSP